MAAHQSNRSNLGHKRKGHDTTSDTAMALRTLLNDDTPPDINPVAYGPYGEIVTAVSEARQQYGKQGARKAFQGLVIDKPELSNLVAGSLHREKTCWTDRELLEMEFLPPTWAVRDLLPVGLATLGGKPKLGKSWYALQLACAVVNGEPFLGYSVSQGDVLYLALEDPPRRLQGRLRKQRASGTGLIRFETRWPYLKDGGLDDLAALVGGPDGKHYVLLVIDTFSRAVGGLDQLDPATMTMVMGELQQLAMTHEMVILLIDHHPKGKRDSRDPVGDIYGSIAKGAVVDTALGLYSEEGKSKYELVVTGRDIEGCELSLSFDKTVCCWRSLGDAETICEGTFLFEVYTTIQDLWEEGELATNKSISDRLKRDGGQISRTTNELIRQGKIIKGPTVQTGSAKATPFLPPENAEV
jgi:hypothetical protein